MNEVLITTLVIPKIDTHVLLGMKKNGFGAGRWNGFGGKVQSGEEVGEAARRELLEESGIGDGVLISAGTLKFSFESAEEPSIDMHIFKLENFFDEPVETKEMRPKWFLFEDIPYQDMWPDNEYWLPRFLKGESINGHCHFKDFNTILHFDLST